MQVRNQTRSDKLITQCKYEAVNKKKLRKKDIVYSFFTPKTIRLARLGSNSIGCLLLS